MPAEELSLSNGIVRCGQVWNVNKSPHFNSDHLTGRRRELCPCNLTFLIFFRFVGHTHYVMHINYLMLHYVNGYIYFNQINAVETPLTQWRTPKQIELNFFAYFTYQAIVQTSSSSTVFATVKITVLYSWKYYLFLCLCISLKIGLVSPK